MRYWIKLWTEIVNDPKMGRLSDRQFRTCINLFAIAGIIDRDGELPSQSDIAWQMRVASADLGDDLAALSEVGIIENRNGVLVVRKWQQRNSQAPSSAPPRVLQRVHEYRERQRNEPVTTLHPQVKRGVTPPDTDTDTETEKMIEQKERSLAAIALEKARGTLITSADTEFLAYLIDKFGDEQTAAGITKANKHKDRPFLSLRFVEAVLDNEQKPTRRNGSKPDVPETAEQRRARYVPAGYEELIET